MSPAEPAAGDFCADVSRALAEPMAGQALTAGLWLLLEYNGPWGAQATTENDLPGPAQAWLRAQTAGAGRRLQFIRQQPGRGLSLFVVVVDEAFPRLYRFTLARAPDLLELDLAGVVAGDPALDARLWPHPLYLVCTNGRRDPCCARYGAELYRALQVQVGRAAWQTSHVGGHRFAPNVVVMPAGMFYSRVAPGEVAALVAAVNGDRVWLERFRGRAAYDGVTQAAEYFLRRETGQLAARAWRHRETAALAAGTWRVIFSTADGAGLAATVRVTAAVPPGLLASCGQPQTKPVARYALLSWQAV